MNPAGAGAAKSASATSSSRAARSAAAQRAVVTLFYYEDRAVEEVAIALGMPENTVKTHLSRARALLRDAWIREAPET